MPRTSSRVHVPSLAALLALLGPSLQAQTDAPAALESAPTPVATAAPAIEYDRDVRPILADRCFRCHGPDEGARRAELRLDGFATATADREHGAAIRPGDRDGSELWRRIHSDDPDVVMPPPDSGRRALSPDERELLGAWIDAGAPYTEHWSFVAPERPAVPRVDPRWCRTPIDAFVLEKLRAHGLDPAPQASPAVLVRRLFLVVTGLPPTPDETAAFVADPSDAAWDALVDRLFRDEPYRSRYAERMATPWLDMARYADTSGIHMDAGRQMWKYRDWVLEAFRDNLPYDRFVRDQIAGDLWPDASLDQKVASGFNRCHVTTDEGGAIAEEYLVEYAVDRTATTGSVFLGLTLGCARCHEHKFDPVSQDEFYSLYAYFNSIEEPGLYSQQPNPQRAFEPFLAVPSPAQTQRRTEIETAIATAKAELDSAGPEEAAQADQWQQQLRERAGARWVDTAVLTATSSNGATMTIETDGSVRSSGANPPRDVHTVTLSTAATGLRLLCLQALADPGNGEGKVGRAENGNAVLQSIAVEARSLRDPALRETVPLVWAWADIEQQDGDFSVTNVLAADDGAGWAVAAHQHPVGPRTALFLAEQPFGFDGGTELTVTLRYDSGYDRHVFGRVRLQVGAIDDRGLDLLPEATSGWFRAGPFDGATSDEVWERADGPEAVAAIDTKASFGEAVPAGAGKRERRWRHEPQFREGRINALPNGTNRHYVAERVYAPSKRKRGLSLGSDDGFRLYVDGAEVAQRRVDRAVGMDQDRAEVEFGAGVHLLTMKIVNTGGQAGFYLARTPRDDELDGALVAALLPDERRAPLEDPIRTAWRLRFSPEYRRKTEALAGLEKDLADLDRAVPLTMVMRERDTPRQTFVLTRGEYDKPDQSRPVRRGVPKSLGALPDGAPADRRGLALWLTSPQNPLFDRVQANRIWEVAFGTGLVRTSEDFGMQGEWPSHRELLDWLAVELRESGRDLQHVLKLVLTSATFRQDHRRSAEAAAKDPDCRLLGWYPRRRLTAEQLRDQALYVGGLLVEQFGGPSVKPTQPKGLWSEVAMVQSNTRTYEPGSGDDLHRRSLYTYQKRACPPPNMLAFDAPTREFCTVRRLSTNTPLQALVLWNDEHFVEAARALAERCQDAGAELADAGARDDARIAAMFVRCTGAPPDDTARAAARALLQRCRERYAAAPADAAALIATGTRPPRADLDPTDLAALLVVASAVLNLDATICVP